MKQSRVPSIRSRRVVSNGGPHLSVAYDLTCFVNNLKHGLNMVQTWSKLELSLSQLGSSLSKLGVSLSKRGLSLSKLDLSLSNLGLSLPNRPRPNPEQFVSGGRRNTFSSCKFQKMLPAKTEKYIRRQT